ncbi:MAG: Zinc-specific metallo-regulatory protein [Bacteroidetes bacterium ADurb.Bin041]|jgi:Fur family ferric uptake transcriptional regulator|nr:transcriptional repressor [Bacteroidales bacterium]OQC36747.1 MAG: Zinc-specific metallo-regulatory protein [Bacteroidetes bacterium ADurb.Bin041]
MLHKSDISTSELLKKHNLSQTKVRKQLINILKNSNVALSASDVARQMPATCDRVTLYRNFKTLVEKGILHQITINNHESFYVLPQIDSKTNENNTEHIHFRCVKCNIVQCLHSSPIESINLPEGFSKLDTNFIVYGTCKNCNTISN